MSDLIVEAIQSRAVMTFFYKGARRVVEPHTYGRDTKGHDTLCAWQISGGSGVGFRDFHLSEMSSLGVTGDHFDAPRPKYRRGDTTMTTIYAQL